MKIKLSIGFFSLALLLGCSKGEDELKSPGYFNLTVVQQTPDGGRQRSVQVIDKSYDLGDIKASKEFFFLLTNNGGKAISNVTLEVDNDQFVVSPKKISLVSPSGVGGNTAVPLISIGAIHGLQLNGIGYTDLLPLGENKLKLTISGTTTENGATRQVSSDFELIVNAKQMDITLYSGGQLTDYTAPVSYCIGCEFESGLPYVAAYDFEPTDFKIKNSGNVSVLLTFNSLSPDPGIVLQLEPNETKTVSFPPLVNSDYYYYFVSIDGDGTISDQSRIKIGTNGKAYLILQH